MTCSTGSGGASSRTGRGQRGQSRDLGERAGARDAAFGQVAFERAEAVEAAGAEADGEAVDQQSEIGRRRLAGQRAVDRPGRERLDAGGDEAEALDAEAGLDLLDLRPDQPSQMGRVAGRAGEADSRYCSIIVDALAGQDEAADAEARLRQDRNELAQRLGAGFGDRLGGGDRLHEAEQDRRAAPRGRSDRTARRRGRAPDRGG